METACEKAALAVVLPRLTSETALEEASSCSDGYKQTQETLHV
jgi:hypothetical protein